MGVAHALDSDNIEADSTSTIFARKSDKTRTNIPLTTNLQNGAGLSIYQQKIVNDLKFQVANKLARDKEIARQKKARLAAIEAREALLKQRAAIKTAPAVTQVVKPVYRIITHPASPGNLYIAGSCTYGVKMWRPDIPNMWGNASQWLYSAQRAGWATGSVPRVGAVAWLKGGNHVALVISLNPLQIREMNYNYLWNVHVRTINASDWMYIY